jgi:hypothetical protein
MKNQIVCPARCSGGYADRVKSVSQRQAGITPDIARAAKLNQNERLTTCFYCDCVWREVLDTHSLRTRPEVLGTYKGVVFYPEQWLQDAIDRLGREPK